MPKPFSPPRLYLKTQGKANTIDQQIMAIALCPPTVCGCQPKGRDGGSRVACERGPRPSVLAGRFGKSLLYGAVVSPC